MISRLFCLLKATLWVCGFFAVKKSHMTLLIDASMALTAPLYAPPQGSEAENQPRINIQKHDQ